MIGSQAVRMQAFGGITAATNADVTHGPFEVLGAGIVSILFLNNPATAVNSSAKWATLEVRGGDTTVFTNASVIYQGTTNATAASSQFVLQVYNNTAGPSISMLTIDRPVSRYLFASTRPPASHTIPTIIFEAAEIPQAPNTDAERGVLQSQYFGQGSDRTL